MPAVENRMWTVIRKKHPTVSVADIEQLAEVSQEEAKIFLLKLDLGGYVKQRADGEWILLKDAGPKPPVRLAEEKSEFQVAGGFQKTKAKTGDAFRRPVSPKEKGGRANKSLLGPIVEYLGRKNEFTLNDLLQEKGLNRRTTLQALNKLVKEGSLIVTKVEYVPRTAKTGRRRIKNPSFQRIEALQARLNSQYKRETVRDRIWRVLRRVRRFTRQSLTHESGCNFHAVDDMVKLLSKHQYIKCVGKKGTKKVFVLADDPGPKRPETPGKRRSRPDQTTMD